MLVLADVAALLFDKAPHGAVELGIRQPVGGVRGDGLEAALNFVLALGARVEAPQPLGDGVIEALVVASLEMQEFALLAAAPVAPEQGFVVVEEKRRGDIAARVLGIDQQ